jgi:hypothetical protein
MENYGGKSKSKIQGDASDYIEENIKMDFREIFRDGLKWIHLAEDREKWRVL